MSQALLFARQDQHRKTSWCSHFLRRLLHQGYSEGFVLIISVTAIILFLSFITTLLFVTAQPIDAVTMSKSPRTNPIISLETRLKGALWGFFSGDALAAPTHWYYGGVSQIRADYGPDGIVDYTKPKYELAGSIMNKSDINGGGRGRFTSSQQTIIGDVINHGKRELWNPAKSIHYHATLQKGENTLEVQLARVLMKSIIAMNGRFDAQHFRQAYIDFMTTPGSHNDAYASTCHRMYFANLKFKGLPPQDCPDNDHHNVDTIDGLVLPTIAAMTASTQQEAGEVAAETVAVTRRSKQLQGVSRAWGQLVYQSLHEDSEDRMTTHLNKCAQDLGLGRPPSSRGANQMTACYLSSSMPPTLDTIFKYLPEQDAWTGLVANANVGGENVHRGSILGAILGARATYQGLPSRLMDGLYDKTLLQTEIDNFTKVILQNSK